MDGVDAAGDRLGRILKLVATPPRPRTGEVLAVVLVQLSEEPQVFTDARERTRASGGRTGREPGDVALQLTLTAAG